MKHEIDFKKGNAYHIDYKEGREKQYKVTLTHFWPKTMLFCRVRNEETGYEWETMLSRLTEIKEN